MIADAHIEEGLRLANLSLALVQELSLAQHRLGNAYWLVGALELAAGRTDAAVANFDRSRACFSSDDERPEVLPADGIAQSP